MKNKFILLDEEEKQTNDKKQKEQISKMTKIERFSIALKAKMLGKHMSDGWLYKFIIYVLLITIGFIYVYPIFYMISRSLMSREDLINAMVLWVPTDFNLENYSKAFSTLDYFKTLFNSLVINLLPALIQTGVTAVIGYGFAKYKFKFKNLWLIIVILTFIIPSQIYSIPKYQMFYSMGLLENPLAIILPAMFGQGINSAIFILIFYQFFKTVPKALDEAAEMEGAGELHLFFKINVPLAIPAFITTFLFSFVWYWNETSNVALYLGNSWPSLQIKLGNFSSAFTGDEAALLNEGIRLAATLLIILPMLIVYFALQKYFIEGIEKSGIAGGE